AARGVPGGVVADRLLGGEELGHEGEPLQCHRQGGEVEVLALVLVLAAVEQGQLGRLVQRDQEGALARDVNAGRRVRLHGRVFRGGLLLGLAAFRLGGGDLLNALEAGFEADPDHAALRRGDGPFSSGSALDRRGEGGGGGGGGLWALLPLLLPLLLF